jgi:hypothetical protein
VGQRGKQLSFSLEPAKSLGVIRAGGEQSFQCDLTLELRVERLIHLAHATRADKRQDLYEPSWSPAESAIDANAAQFSPSRIQLGQVYAPTGSWAFRRQVDD